MKFSGCRRDVEINMWGVTSSRDELTGDFGDGREAISIGVCDLSRRLVGKAVACILGLLQQNRPLADVLTMLVSVCFSGKSEYTTEAADSLFYQYTA